MKNLNLFTSLLGVAYGILLIVIFFVRTKFTEPFRIDALLMPQASESSRPVNLVAGLIIAGYSIYSLLHG
ncbi:MAG: hypothetical protein HY886_09905 [Deltaproteobacteria bacterium]|nr:hypothetical protein [Deltaproteobacteria bacterium]